MNTSAGAAYGIPQYIHSECGFVREATLWLLAQRNSSEEHRHHCQEIDEEHDGFRAAPETRAVSHLLVHIAISPRMAFQIHSAEKRTTLEGFDFGAFLRDLPAEEQKPRTKAEIVALLADEAERFASFPDGCSGEFLAQRVTLPHRFEMLLGVKEHEMHHRGQLMLIERMIGIVPHLTRQFQARVAAMSGGGKQ